MSSDSDTCEKARHAAESAMLALVAHAEGLLGRWEMNCRTAIRHPDMATRVAAQARADAYRVALGEIVSACDRLFLAHGGPNEILLRWSAIHAHRKVFVERESVE